MQGKCNYLETKMECASCLYFRWSDCPPDLLFIIFKKLNTDDLEACFKVNRAWRDVAIYFCDHYQLWKDLVENSMFNKGAHIKHQSKSASYKDIYLNSILWQDISLAKYNISYHGSEYVRLIHVHKDTFIIITTKSVQLLNVENLNVLKDLDICCTDYQHNTYLTVTINHPIPKVVPTEPSYTLMVSKNGNCRCSESEYIYPIPTTNLWKIEESVCYVVDESFTVWRYDCNCDKHLRAMARYYGDRDAVYGLSLYNSELYLYTVDGRVFLVDGEKRQVNVAFRWTVPAMCCDLELYWFDRITVIYGSNTAKELWYSYDPKTQVTCFIFPNLTAAKRHNNYLLLGYCNGLLEIYKYSERHKFTKKPEIHFNLQYTQECMPIRDIEIYEGHRTHTIFVLIGERIAKIHLTHRSDDIL